jgi:hypothetical protein
LAAIELIEVVRMISGERGVEWCERSLLGGPLFIAARLPWGCCKGAAMAWRFQQAKGQAKDGSV